MRLGVVSDTHNFFDPKIPLLFAGVHHILHAGDIGLPRILEQLATIAPVTAVAGNTDEPTFGYEPWKQLELNGRRFLLQHIVNPHSPDELLLRHIDTHFPDAVIFGHTHKPFSTRIGPVLFFNPGYAGKTRFGMPRSVAILDCTRKMLTWEYFPL